MLEPHSFVSQVHPRFSYTPNGEMFPVTPPRTPDTELAELPVVTQPLLERNVAPTIECKCVVWLDPASLPEKVRQKGIPPECQAVDTVDDHVSCASSSQTSNPCPILLLKTSNALYFSSGMVATTHRKETICTEPRFAPSTCGCVARIVCAWNIITVAPIAATSAPRYV